MINVLSVFGTRPEAIKMCPLVLELEKNPNFNSVVCVTGQHKEMLKQVLDVFDIQPNYDLQIMSDKQTLSSITCKVIDGISNIINIVKPDIVLVHGDTSTAFAAGLAAFYLGVPVGHVEAGLRTYDIHSPFPEEFNRQAIDLFANLYFAPTKLAKDRLIKENKSADNIFVTGNTVIDAIKTTINKKYIDENLKWASDSKLILLTCHRRENLGKAMESIFNALYRFVKENKDVKLIYPIHLNPKVREIACKVFGNCERIRLIEPLDLVAFHHYINAAYLVVTDSGGIQEEAPFLGKPVFVTRTETERPEGVEAGTLKLVGVDEEFIYNQLNNIFNSSALYTSMSKAINPYGDGHASERIVEILYEKFKV